MTPDWLALAKAYGLKALSFTWALAKDPLARARARHRAMRGDDLAASASLKRLVGTELAKLAKSSRLPPELRNEAFRTWVLSEGAVESFVEVLVAKAGGNESVADLACTELARTYSQRMGETSRLALGPINLVVDDLFGQLTATAAAHQAFQAAVALRTSAQLSAFEGMSRGRSPEAELLRLRTLARHLLAAGRKAWRTPDSLAPLTLEAYEDEAGKEPRPVARAELIEALNASKSILLYGDGGVGKTTLLLELASACLDANERAPLFVDAAIWARTGGSVAEYIARTPAAQVLGISTADVVGLAQRGMCVLLVNGWNEIPAERKVLCHEALAQLTTTAPALAAVIATRTAHDTASMPNVKRVIVRGLTWRGQSAVVRSILPALTAEQLIEYLARDSRLRHAARSPLILQGLIAQSRSGALSASVSVFDLLKAVVDSYEADERRQLLLAEHPLFRLHARYLQELAGRMNMDRTTGLSRGDALSTLGAVSARLASERLLGTAIHPPELLDALASHHLLQVQDDLVRFAHQRFQEYFGAVQLLDAMSRPAYPPDLLIRAVNEPAWADSFALVAGRLKASGTAAMRAALVQAAASCDLSYACDLVGLCGFAGSDDADLHQRLVSAVSELWGSDLSHVKDLAVACKIASALPIFAGDLLALFESEDKQTRLHSHRLNGTPVSLKQLGADALTRISGWPPEQRAEFLHEVAGNPENYDFIAHAASADPDANARAAAISALFWNYPAATAAVNAWLDAPLEVQTRHELLNSIAHELEDGFFVEEIRARLQSIAAAELPDEIRLRFALAFPAEVGPSAVGLVLACLKNENHRDPPDTLLAIAQAHASDRLRALAHELVTAPRGLPDWAGQILLGESTDQKMSAFERAWSALQAGDIKHLRAQLIGPLSGLSQTRRSVESWMLYHHDRFRASDSVHERGREVRALLANAPGDDLFRVVLELSMTASYDDAVELVDLLLSRISTGQGERPQANAWVPTPEQFNTLFEQLRDKSEGNRSPQDSLFAHLACVASHVSPALFGPLILDALRRHLDAWSAYRAALAEWQSRTGTPRPSNPSLGNYIISALVRWGMDALPGVLELLSHPSAMELVPAAVGRIVALPWAAKSKAILSRGVGTDIDEGRTRRQAGCSFRQPSAEYQAATDHAARVVSGLLDAELVRQLAARSDGAEWNAEQAEHQVGQLVGTLATIPSPEVVETVTRALCSGMVNLYGFCGVLRSLVRQGWTFADQEVAGALESVVERESKPTWVDDSTRHALGECFQLLLVVESPATLRRPLSHYLQEWRRFAHVGEVIRSLGDMNSEGAWPALIELGDELATRGQLPDDYLYSLVTALSPRVFDDFARRIVAGVLTTWRVNAWKSGRIAPKVADVAKSAPEHLDSLVQACRQAASPVADALIGEVLSLSSCDDAIRQRLALEALDAGRANNTNAPAHRTLVGMFQRHVPLGGDQYEVHARACNPLRRDLYVRARAGGPTANAARQILASLECSRREVERPDDEPRHPDYLDGHAWTQALVSAPEARLQADPR